MSVAYISIADDIGKPQVEKIEAAAQAGRSIVIVHAICQTLPGRRTMQRRLKAAGVKPAIAHNVGWATCLPSTETKDAKQAQTTPAPEPTPAAADSGEPAAGDSSPAGVPVGRRAGRGKRGKG